MVYRTVYKINDYRLLERVFMNKKEMITQEEVKKMLHYDPDSGLFTWLIASARYARTGKRAGCVIGNGYIRIKIRGAEYKAHRLAWLYVYGLFPAMEIDHINGARADNRLANLRLATRSQNAINSGAKPSNTSGFKGCHWNKKDKKWCVQGSSNGKRYSLGRFTTVEAASEAYREFSKKYHGEFYHE